MVRHVVVHGFVFGAFSIERAYARILALSLCTLCANGAFFLSSSSHSAYGIVYFCVNLFKNSSEFVAVFFKLFLYTPSSMREKNIGFNIFWVKVYFGAARAVSN